MRPIYYLSDHFNVALELGHDCITPDRGTERHLTKLTLAQQLSHGRGYCSPGAAPVHHLRAVDAAAMASDSGNVLGGDKTAGDNYGVQAEAWW